MFFFEGTAGEAPTYFFFIFVSELFFRSLLAT